MVISESQKRCIYQQHNVFCEEDLANAQLIAAAPELLEACEAFIDSSLYINGKQENTIPGLKRARTLAGRAIAKAEGRE